MNAEGIFHPQLAITIQDESSRLQGYLVIDSTVRGRAVGGVRMLPDVSLDETKELARTMTLKYSFSGLALGGAKAAVVGDPEMPAGEKHQILVNFFKALLPVLTSGFYVPRPDMGTTNAELRRAAEVVGLRKNRRINGSGERSGLYTGFSVVGGAIEALERLQIPLPGCTVAIEGFGKVGSAVARLFSDYGAKIVAVSTRYGAIYSSRGLDVPELFRLYERHGSRMVEVYREAEKIGVGNLLELGVDVLSPCARYHSIDSDNAPKIAAKIISAGANNPVTAEAERILFERGNLCLPDFATNCGGVLGEAIEFAGLNERFIRDFVITKIRARVAEILDLCDKAQQPAREYWEPIILERFLAMKKRAERPSVSGRVLRAGRALYRHGFVPSILVRRLAPRYFAGLLKR